jgi:4-hydroxybenzoate polyprenyltransferase
MSTRELLAAYVRQRVRPRVLVPLALLLALAGRLLSPLEQFHTGAFVLAMAQAFVFTLAFRVWDDLEDRDADAAHHPERVMGRSGRVAPFVVLIVVLGISGVLSFLALSEPLQRSMAIAVAAGILSGWYAVRPSENWNPVAGGLIVLVKYPLIAYAIAPALPDAPSSRTLVVLGALYAFICAYEYADDAELRHFISSRRSLP